MAWCLLSFLAGKSRNRLGLIWPEPGLSEEVKMKRSGFALTGAAGLLAFLFVSAQAAAAPICTGTTDTFTDGNGSVTDAFLSTAGNCVQAGDKLFGNFNLGTITGGTVQFSLVTVAGQDFHEIAFNDNYASATSYSLSFNVEVTGAGLAISALDGDFTQTDGTSLLTKNSTPTGTPAGGISETKVGTIVQPGSITKITYGPGITDLQIAETLVDNGVVSSINDTVVEGLPLRAPEPASLALVGLGLSALGFVRRRKQKQS
jgi:hypothetical protein